MGCCFRRAEKVTADGASDPQIAKHITPAGQRRCTDVFWLLVFAAAWVSFIVVTLIGVQDGNPGKLFRPRDFQGAYCGLETQWNNGPNLVGKDKQSYMMNVGVVTDQIAKQTLCSTAASSYLLGSTSPLDSLQQDLYACGCCLRPCKSCTGSLALGKGGNIADSGLLQTTISNRMSELTSTSGGSQLFDPAGFNGDIASTLWNEATKHFIRVCLEDCSVDFKALDTGPTRSYDYAPGADSPLRAAWNALKNSNDSVIVTLKSTILNQFSFRALPLSVCPYSPVYCVPVPGVEFSNLAGDFCSFEMAANVKQAIGDMAASTFTSLGGNAFANATSMTLGTWLGDFEKSIDSFVIVALLAFIIGLIFLVLLRFCVGPCIWLSALFVLLLFLVGGGIVFVRSGQCAGADLFDTGRQVLVAVGVAGHSAVMTATTGDPSPSESLVGDGSGYTGVQFRSRSGFLCRNWDTVGPQYWPALREKGNLRENFCRNPYNDSSPFQASTIWCYTTDTEKPWEICYPIGVIQPECRTGYAVTSPTARDFLKVGAVVLWIFALIWFLILVCFCSRIRLAIALNKVAAQYLSHSPHILLVPIVQAVCGILWALIWAFSACFLLSQVPDAYVSKSAYATYEEAYGTADSPGACTSKWPTGFVWRDETCEGPDPKCWRCAPPRYIFDVRFFISLFTYLWNNAFLIALGQCCIAGAVGVWFFTPNDRKSRVASVSRSIYICFRFHTGSMAFGAFILAVVQLIRVLLMYFERQATAQKNKLMACLLKVLQYALWCLERFIKFLNKNAYVQVALNGTSFCTSAREAWKIITANMLRFGVVAVLGRVIHIIGIVFITTATTVLGYFIMKSMHPELYPVVPILLYISVSYIVARLYMSVFGMAVDTCLQCVVCAEKMQHDASFVPSALSRVLKERKGAWKDGEPEE